MLFRWIYLLFLFISFPSFAASILVEIPAQSIPIASAEAKVSYGHAETLKLLYSDGNYYRNIFVVNKPGLYKVEITIKLLSGEVLSDWATGYIHNETEISGVSATINPSCYSTTFSVFWIYKNYQNKLFGFSLDSSLLKRITIPNIDSIATEFYNEGLNWYSEYDVHYELLDDDFIPLIKYPLGYFRNAITTCQTLLAFHSRFKKTGDSVYYRGFINNANWLVNNNHSGYYLFEFDFLHDHGTLLKKNWVSAMAQGYAAGSLSYAFYVTGDSTYLKEADSVFVTLHQNSSEFWCFMVDNKGYYWLEEYPNKDLCHVLNGKLAALWGIFQYYAVTRNKLALALFEAGLKSIVDHFRIWNVNNSNRSYYCLHHESKDHYHLVHQTQLLAFANKFNIHELYNAFYCLINSNVLVEPEIIEMGSTTATSEVTVLSPIRWVIEEKTDWLYAEIVNNKINITTEDNLSDQVRAANLHVNFDNGDQRIIRVNQKTLYFFSINSVLSDLESNGDTILIPYTTNVPGFDITQNSEWFYIDTVSTNLRLICSENTSFFPRDGEFTIYCDNLPVSGFKVSQKAKLPYILIDPDTVFIDSPDYYEVSVKTNIPDVAVITFEDWLNFKWINGVLLIRASSINSIGRVYLDSPYLSGCLLVVPEGFTSEIKIPYQPDYSVFPNPARDILHLKTGGTTTISYEFKNMSGITLKSGIMNESETIDVSGYDPGLYFVVIKTSFGLPHVVKVILQ